MDGVLSINKPTGVTSYEVVARLKRLTGKRRIGHGGTLDPLACGVLPIFFGKATRVIEYFQNSRKTYKADIELGRTTDTYDAEGEVTSEKDCSYVTRQTLEEALCKFTGNIKQLPPMYSAVKHNGKRLYELAREGKEVTRKQRDAVVYEIKLNEWENPSFSITVECGKGTYIRSLAYDIGESLGCGAYLKALERTKYGSFNVEESSTLEEMEKAALEGTWQKKLKSIDYVLEDMPEIKLGDDDIKKVVNGVFVEIKNEELKDGAILRIYDKEGGFTAIARYNKTDMLLHPVKVFK